MTDRYLRELIGEYIDKPLPQNTVWNINFPGCAPEDCKGVKHGCAVSQDDFYTDSFTCKTLGDGTVEYTSCPAETGTAAKAPTLAQCVTTTSPSAP